VTQLTYHCVDFDAGAHKCSLMSRRVVWAASIAAATALALLSCSDPVTPLPDSAREFVPETVYRVWWREMEECAGRTASFDEVRWYVVPGEEPFQVAGLDRPVVGYWDPHGNRIVVLQFLPNQRAPIIRHEALHAILRTTDHPPEFFVDRCGAVIDSPDSPPLPPKQPFVGS
jgi:hypothetical protein